MSTFSVSQRPNLIEIVGADEPITYEISGIDIPVLTDLSFAVWHILPVAIVKGFDIHIDGPVDELVRINAENTARTWEMWDPKKYRSVKVTSSANSVAPTNQRGEALTLFSGGVDSTYMLLQRGAQKVRSPVLTMQGMDYSVENDELFQKSLQHTQPLLDELNYSRIAVKSNVLEYVRGDHSWAMLLAGFSWIFRDLYERTYFAADLTLEQDMVLFPWGLNHITNRFLRGHHYACEPLNEDASRSQKIDAIALNRTALDTISFCKDRSVRPLNCGRCQKCIRTKVAFLGMTGTLPGGVFIDDGMPEDALQSVGRNESAFLIDLYQRARDKGNLEKIPEVVAYMNELRRKPQKTAPPPTWRTKLKAAFNRQ